MARISQKITLSASCDIPFNKLSLSQSNVRRLKAGVSIDDLAEDIARRGLLQSLNVRPVLDAAGTETGVFEIPAGGRRYRALEQLVKQKRLSKTAPVPCIVRDPTVEVSAEEDSLAENVHRVALHPLDQFRAFKALHDQGAGENDIAARFFVPLAVVKQRLRLASVSESRSSAGRWPGWRPSPSHDRQAGNGAQNSARRYRDRDIPCRPRRWTWRCR